MALGPDERRSPSRTRYPSSRALSVHGPGQGSRRTPSGDDVEDPTCGRLPPATCRATTPAIRGLKRGLGHGDLHGGNILVDERGRVFLIDWSRWGAHPVGSDVGKYMLGAVHRSRAVRGPGAAPRLCGARSAPTSTTWSSRPATPGSASCSRCSPGRSGHSTCPRWRKRGHAPPADARARSVNSGGQQILNNFRLLKMSIMLPVAEADLAADDVAHLLGRDAREGVLHLRARRPHAPDRSSSGTAAWTGIPSAARRCSAAAGNGGRCSGPGRRRRRRCRGRRSTSPRP